MRASRSGIGLVLLALCACSQRIAVLSPAESAAGSDASRGGSGNGAGGSAGRGTDADDFGDADAATPAGRCDACGATELCAVDVCEDPRGVTRVVTSFAHTCEVADGRLYCWGNNDQGQLGVGDRVNRLAPERVGSFNDWLRVATGEQHSCAIRAPGALYCYGDNSTGQLGTSDTTTRLEPVRVDTDVLAREVACGGDGCCALGADGELLCWGDNREGKVGQDDAFGSPDVTAPLVVDPGTRWRAVAVGQGHVCAIKESGALGCWGRNTNAQLGLGGLEPGQTRVPMRVGNGTDWLQIAASQHDSCGVRGDGSLWCWGENGHYELGSPELEAKIAAPRQVGTDLDWEEVATGWFHTCARKHDGRLLCWGRAIEGQLARESIDPLLEPQAITMPDHYRQVTAGNFHTCAIDDTAALYCWGANESGELGTGDDARRHAPAAVE